MVVCWGDVYVFFESMMLCCMIVIFCVTVKYMFVVGWCLCNLWFLNVCIYIYRYIMIIKVLSQINNKVLLFEMFLVVLVKCDKFE